MLAAAIAAGVSGIALAAMDYTGTDYEPWNGVAGGVVWRGTGATFHNDYVADIAADGTIGTPYAMTSDQGATAWQRFASNQTAYSSPGMLLVYDKANSDDETPVAYTQNSEAQFSPLTIGGLWVKTLAANDSPFQIGQAGTRVTEFGNTSYEGTTLLKFDASFNLDRQSPCNFYGKVNVDVAQDATFAINPTYPNQQAYVPAGSTLVLTGEGTITTPVNVGLVVAGTLDLSAETVPTIGGNVTLSPDSTIALPTDATSATVCTGTLSAPAPVNVKIGDADPVTAELTVDGGAITAITPVVLEQTFTENFPSVVPAYYTYTFVGGETADTTVAIPGVEVYGTLKTTGYVSLTDLKVLNGGTLDVVDGNTAATAFNDGWDNIIRGNLIVRAGATLTTTQGDFIDWYGATAQTIDIYGTLALGTSRWSIKTTTACTFNLYPGAVVSGTGDDNGVLDLIASDSKLNVYSGENGGVVVIEGKIKTRNANTPIWVDTNTTLKIGGLNAGGVNKSGNGTLEISGTVTNPGASTVSEGTVAFVDTTVAVPLTVNAGKTVSASASEGVTVPLNATMNAGAHITVSGAGVVNGTVTFGGFPTGTLTGLNTSTWQGTVTVPAASGNLSKLADCGNANSVIDFAGTTGSSCYIMAAGNTTYNVGAINFSGDTVLDNGSSGSIVNFAKISGTGALTLTGWAGASSARYNLNEVDGYSGTLTVANNITREQGGTLTIGIGNIVSETTTPGSCVLPITNTAVENTTGTVVYNLDNATLNGEEVALEAKDDGIYVANTTVASIGEGDNIEYFDTLADAVEAAEDDAVINLLKDITLTEAVTVDKELSLYSEGAVTISGSGMMLNIAADSSLMLYTGDQGSINVSCQIGFMGAGATLVTDSRVTVGVTRPYTGISGVVNPTADTPEEGWTTYTLSPMVTVAVIAGNSVVTGAATGTYAPGTVLTFTVTPNSGYAVDSVTVGGVEVEPVEGVYTVTVGDTAMQIVVNTSEIGGGAYEVTAETTLGEGGTLNIGTATTIKIGNYDVTDGFAIDNGTATLQAPELAAAPTIDGTTVTLSTADLVEGLYYGVGASATLEGLARPNALTQYDGTNIGDCLEAPKPEGDSGFFCIYVDIKE